MIEGVEVIDFHGHQGTWDFVGMLDDLPNMLRIMDLAGIDKGCLFNIHYADARIGHDQLAGLIARAPDRLIGFAYASPHHPQMVEEAKRAIDVLGYRAIKIYPPYGDIYLTDKRWDPIYKFADERGLAVISHTGSEVSCEPEQFDEVAARFPRANFVVGHSGNVQPQRDQAIRVAAKHPNVYLETCSTFRSLRVIEDLVAGAGAHKVLYGSDMPLMDARSQIGKILCADLSDADKALLLGGNAKRLLKL